MNGQLQFTLFFEQEHAVRLRKNPNATSPSCRSARTPHRQIWSEDGAERSLERSIVVQFAFGRHSIKVASSNQRRQLALAGSAGLIAHEFDPFDQLRIGASGPVMNVNSLPPGVAMRNWLAAIGLSTLQQQFGSVQLARSFVLKHANGNGRR